MSRATPEILQVSDALIYGNYSHVNQIRQQVLAGLAKPAGQRTLPTILLYDEPGLRLYDRITTDATEYYLFGLEENLLKDYAGDIVNAMHVRNGGDVIPGEIILELGAGALRKTCLILRAISKLVPVPDASPPITYYALDLEKNELERTLCQLVESDIGKELDERIEVKGICANYDTGLSFVEEGSLQRRDNVHFTWHTQRYESARSEGYSSLGTDSTDAMSPSTDGATSPPSSPGSVQPPLHILFLGSSLGNFSREEGAKFLRNLPLRPGTDDTLLLGLDHDNSPGQIEVAYNDPAGHTRRFIMNGLRSAGKVLGNEHMFDTDKWEYVNSYNVEKRRHEAYYKSKGHQTVQDPAPEKEFTFTPDELIEIEVSNKYSEIDSYSLFTEANLRPIQRWTDSASQYSLWLLERPPFIFPLLTSPDPVEASQLTHTSSAFGIPSIRDWEVMWATWDFITLSMIPPSMLFQKPIHLRHICLFYLGHVPTFLDIHLSRLLEESHTQPEIFKVRANKRWQWDLVPDNGGRQTIFERGIDPHVDNPSECNPHSEVPQSDADWPSLASILDFRRRVRERLLRLYSEIASGHRVLNRKIGRVLFMTFEHEGWHAETLLYMLLQRAGSGLISPPGFCPPPWEKLAAAWNSAPIPKSDTVTLGPAIVTIGHDDFEVDDADPEKTKNVVSHEFGWDNEHPKREMHVEKFRISWRPVTNGQFYAFSQGSGKGKVQLPATWIEDDGEIKVQTLYGPVPLEVAQYWPVMTSYDDLSTYAIVNGGRLPTDPELRLFFDKFHAGYEGGANYGYRNWHPIPSTTGVEKIKGVGHNGGIWEWTSTAFDKVDGFVPSTLYPGYSMDFFDGLHQVVIGGSYATIPRIAARRSVRNWFQRNYPYAWIGARLAYDINTSMDPQIHERC